MEEMRQELEKLRQEIENERRRHGKELSKLSGQLAVMASEAESDSEPEEEKPKEKPKKKVEKAESSDEAEEPVKEEPVKKPEPVKQIEPGSVEDTNFNQFEREGLRAHNEYRARHGCPPLRLTRELCNFAQEWSNHLASICTLKHRSPHTGKGENLFMSGGMKVDGTTAVKSWYDEIRYYSYGSGFSGKTGHFTQVVWKGSKELGIAISRNNRGQVYVAANYLPSGNMQGAFTQNVPPPVR